MLQLSCLFKNNSFLFKNDSCLFKNNSCLFKNNSCLFKNNSCLFKNDSCLFKNNSCLFKNNSCLFKNNSCLFRNNPFLACLKIKIKEQFFHARDDWKAMENITVKLFCEVNFFLLTAAKILRFRFNLFLIDDNIEFY